MPLVAIGGITPERAPGVIAAGAQSVAVITDFMTAADPEARVRAWLDWAADSARGRSAHGKSVAKFKKWTTLPHDPRLRSRGR